MISWVVAPSAHRCWKMVIMFALSAFFTWAMREGIAAANPVVATNKHGISKSRDRTLSDAELAALWKSLPTDQYGAIFKLLLLTGQRREEIEGLRWSEIDHHKALIAFPGERTKNGRPHDVPLADTALAILEAQPRREGRDRIFGETYDLAPRHCYRCIEFRTLGVFPIGRCQRVGSGKSSPVIS